MFSWRRIRTSVQKVLCYTSITCMETGIVLLKKPQGRVLSQESHKYKCLSFPSRMIRFGMANRDLWHASPHPASQQQALCCVRLTNKLKFPPLSETNQRENYSQNMFVFSKRFKSCTGKLIQKKSNFLMVRFFGEPQK